MPINIFFCYAHEDETLLKKLMQQLRPLQREGLIDTWYDRDISAGTEWESQINQHLNNADIILLLISPDFMDSDYCYGKEMKQALERHKRKEARVIPIILRPVYWQGVLGALQALPKDAIPVLNENRHSLDDAFFDIAESIRRIIEELLVQAQIELERVKAADELQVHKAQDELKQTRVKELLAKGRALYKEKHYREAISNYSKVISLDPTSTNAYYYRGNTYATLNEYQKAIADYDQALTHNPGNTNVQERREEAVRALKEKQTQSQIVAEPKPVIVKQELPSQKSSSVTTGTTPAKLPSPPPAVVDTQTLQRRISESFQIIGVLGFFSLVISLSINIVQAGEGHSPAWWIWTSSITLSIILFLGGYLVGGVIEKMSPEQFSKAIIGPLDTIMTIISIAGMIGLTIEIVLAILDHSPTWWIWTITIGMIFVGPIFSNSKN